MRSSLGRPRTQFPAVVDVNVDGVVIASHTLTKNAERLERILNLVGRRLAHWLKATAQEDPQPLPPPEWTENFKYYSSTLVHLLKEQRERYRLSLAENATAEQLEAQLADELRRALSTFTPEERAFAQKLWESNAIAAPKTTETEQ